MIVYVDSSVVLRHLLGQARTLEWADWQAAYSSEILGLEVRRVIDRLRLNSTLDDNGTAYAQQALMRLERSIGQISLTRRVLRRAAQPMPTAVKTLDAIHLASALLFQERTENILVFATHDFQQATGARALGFEVIGA